jgi:hypothetical protein
MYEEQKSDCLMYEMYYALAALFGYDDDEAIGVTTLGIINTRRD